MEWELKSGQKELLIENNKMLDDLFKKAISKQIPPANEYDCSQHQNACEALIEQLIRDGHLCQEARSQSNTYSLCEVYCREKRINYWREGQDQMMPHIIRGWACSMKMCGAGYPPCSQQLPAKRATGPASY